MSTDASNLPVRRPPQELHTGDIKIEQKPSIEDREDLENEIAVAPPDVLKKDYQDQLAFMEEPVTIRVERSSEKYAPHCIDCWCNGKGAEILMNGKWVETKAIPVGIPVTTKRKYIEILARSKITSVQTRHEDKTVEQPRNFVDRYTSSRAPFSVIEDKSPRGAEWLTNLVRFD